MTEPSRTYQTDNPVQDGYRGATGTAPDQVAPPPRNGRPPPLNEGNLPRARTTDPVSPRGPLDSYGRDSNAVPLRIFPGPDSPREVGPGFIPYYGQPGIPDAPSPGFSAPVYGNSLPPAPPSDNPYYKQFDQFGGPLANPTGAQTATTNPPIRTVRPPVALPAKRPGTGVPPPGETRFVPNEVVVEVSVATTPPAIAALYQRQNLIQLDQLTSQLSGTNLLRARIQDGRTVAAVVLALQADPVVMSAQPNYLFALQQQKNNPRNAPADALQYALAKLRLPQAHQIAMGGKVLVGIIDSGVDVSHPELNGAISESYDAIDGSRKADSHGTAIAGLIVAHAKLTGTAPAARILAARAFDTVGTNTTGSTFNVLKSLDWTAVRGARIVNMSFAGPSDPAIHRAIDSADKNGIVLIAAAGNAGPKSPPLYPGADPLVIAVTATDAQDKYYPASNRGRYIGVAAPGVDILVAAPGGRYQISSGTSFSAAEVSGITALILERKPNLNPESVRRTLLATGRPLPPEGARLVDAWQAVSTDPLVLPVAAR